MDMTQLLPIEPTPSKIDDIEAMACSFLFGGPSCLALNHPNVASFLLETSVKQALRPVHYLCIH